MNSASIVEEYYVPIYIMHTGECSCLGTETVCVVTYTIYEYMLLVIFA